MEDIRFTHSYHNLRFIHNKTLNLGLKGVERAWRSKRREGGAEVPGHRGLYVYTFIPLP